MSKSSSASVSGGGSASGGTIAANDDDLVVLKAAGKRNRMAKSISVSPTGQHLVGQHDGRKVYFVAHARTEKIDNVFAAARALARIAGDEFIIRGALVAGLPKQFRRLLHPKQNVSATLVEVPRSYVIFDIDGVPGVLPWYDPRKSDREDTKSAVEELIRDLLPREFHNVMGWFGFTASHGIKSGMNLRLFYHLARPVDAQELKTWLGYLRHRQVDTAVFSPAQQVLVAPPILQAGVNDPVLIRRGFVGGFRRTVVPPSRESLATVAGIPRTRLRPASANATGSGVAPTGRTRSVGGYRNALALIGDGPGQNGIHEAILSTVGAWVHANGPDADPASLIDDITNQITSTSIDPIRHSAAYISGELDKLPQLLIDVCEMERTSRASNASAQALRMRTAVAAGKALVTTTVASAFTITAHAAKQFITAIPKQIKRRDSVWQRSHENDFGRSYPARSDRTLWRNRGSLTVDVGVGKTEAVIHEIVSLIAANPKIRVAYVVPEHKLAAGVEERFDAVAGSEIAAIWRGITQPDPNEPAETMCRRLEDAEIVRRAATDLNKLCGSEGRGYCPFHPKSGGSCAYIAQRAMKPSIWIVPAAMLTAAVPEPMCRQPVEVGSSAKPRTATPPAFDLLVLDEAPFLNWVGGFDDDGVHVPLTSLDPALYPVSSGKHPQEDEVEIEKALKALRDMAEALYASDVDFRNYYSEHGGRDVTDADPSFSSAADLLWKILDNPQIGPHDTGVKLATQLTQRLTEIARVREMRRLLRIHDEILDAKAALSCLEKSTMEDGTPAIRLRWRENIDSTWLDCPVLYLDGTAKKRLAERWLGPIDELVVAQSAVPFMRTTQIDDRAFGYGSLIAGIDPATARTAVGHQRRISDLMKVALAGTGGTGLFVGPKMLIEQMSEAGTIPSDYGTATYGSLRGVDAFKGVSVAVIVSRPLPAPANVELMAEVIFGRDVQRIREDWYPTTSTIRLMADGTGRHAEIECHPDPDVEIVRWTISEAEVLQAIGRVRGVRRTQADPVLVFVLNKVDLGHLPVSELMTWDELSASCGPTMLMAATGCVPKMWSDIAHMIGRWNDATDAAGNAKAWFRDNPAEKAALDSLFNTGQIKHPLTGITTTFRKESLGLVGKNHRYVWLANGMTIDDARTILP